MSKYYSLLKAVFETKISPILGLAAICFLGSSISALFIVTYSDPSQLLPGIQTVSAEISVPAQIFTQPVVAQKEIIVSLKDQTLVYLEGGKIIGLIKISSGLARTPSPPGEYTVLKKKPTVNYGGRGYYYPNTKWNLMFKKGNPLNYYIHGAYWHHNFGHPMSHGCINVAYADMEGLYNWADEGTKIIIQNESQNLIQFSNKINPDGSQDLQNTGLPAGATSKEKPEVNGLVSGEAIEADMTISELGLSNIKKVIDPSELELGD